MPGEHDRDDLGNERTVTLILYYVAFMIGGDFAAVVTPTASIQATQREKK